MSPFPSVSVIVPTLDRPVALRACISALARQSYPPDRFEVVVVNDSRFPLADEVVRSGERRVELRLIEGPGRGPGAARNAGARASRGEILAFTDDDCVPEPDWLSELVERVSIDPPFGAGGRTTSGLPGNPYAEASQLLVSYVYRAFNPDPEDARFFATNNMALPARAFEAIGGFDESFGRVASEDRDLCDRWIHAGHRLRYAPEAVVAHLREMGLAGFLAQHWNYGCGAWRFRVRREERGRGGLRLEPPSFYSGMVQYPFERNAASPLAMSALMILSQAAATMGYLWMRMREGKRGAR